MCVKTNSTQEAYMAKNTVFKDTKMLSASIFNFKTFVGFHNFYSKIKFMRLCYEC